MITVRTCIRIKRGWSKPVEKQVTLERAAELYRWRYEHKGYTDQFKAAAIGQEVLVNLYGTMTELYNVWKAAGLTDEQINDLPFWKNQD